MAQKFRNMVERGVKNYNKYSGCIKKFCTPIQISGDPMKKNEMGGECGTYGRQERCIQGFGGKI